MTHLQGVVIVVRQTDHGEARVVTCPAYIVVRQSDAFGPEDKIQTTGVIGVEGQLDQVRRLVHQHVHIGQRYGGGEADPAPAIFCRHIHPHRANCQLCETAEIL